MSVAGAKPPFSDPLGVVLPRTSMLPRYRWWLFASLAIWLTGVVPIGSAQSELRECQLDAKYPEVPGLIDLGNSVKAGRANKVVVRLRALASEFPHDPRVLFLLARAEWELKRTDPALVAGKSAHASAPDCRPITEFFGSLLEAQNAWFDAGNHYDSAVARSPDVVSLREKAARALVAASQLDRAEPHWRWLREHDPSSATYQAAWAEVQGWRGLSADAVEGFQKAIALDASVMNGARYRTYGDALRASALPEDALKQYEIALKLDPNNPSAMVAVGHALSDLGRLEHAVSRYEIARQLEKKTGNKKATESLLGLARVQHRRGNTEKAIEYYLDAVNIDPANDALRFEAAQVTASLESQRDEALKLLEPLVLRPDPAIEHVFTMAEIQSWMPNRRKDALELLSPYLNEAPEREKGWTVSRQAVLWQHPSVDLLPWLERLLIHFPHDSSLLRQKAASLGTDRANSPAAIAEYDHLLQLEPQNAEARMARAELVLSSRAAEQPRAPKATSNSSESQTSPPIIEDVKKVRDASTSDVELLTRAGRAFLTLEQNEEAKTTLEKALLVDSKHLPAILGLSEALCRLNRCEEGITLLDQTATTLTEPGAKSSVAQQRLSLKNSRERKEAQRLAGEGALAESEERYRALTMQEPNDVESWVAMGAIQAQQRQFEEALTSFNRALTLHPHHVGALRGAAGTLEALGRFSEARTLLEREATIDPLSDAHQRLDRLQRKERLAKAQRLRHDGDVYKALEELSRLFMEAPDDPTIGLAYGSALLEARRYQEAGDVFGRILEKSPENLDASRGYATAIWESGKRVEGRQLLTRVMDRSSAEERGGLESQLVGWHVLEGEELKREGKLFDALDRYRSAYRMAPDRRDVLIGVGGLYWANKQLDLASKYYYRAAILYPNDVDAVAGAVETLLAHDQVTLALSILKGAGNVTNPRLKALRDRAFVIRDLGAIEDAWKRGDRAVSVDLVQRLANDHPTSSEPFMVLARLYATDEDYGEALHWYYRAAKIQPDNIAALVALIATLESMNRLEEAQDLIAQARALDSGAEPVLEELNKLEAILHVGWGRRHRANYDWDAAYAAYTRALKLDPKAHWILIEMGWMYSENEQYEDAYDIFSFAYQLEPEDRDIWQAQARMLLELGRADDAGDILDRIDENAQSLETTPDHEQMTQLLRADYLVSKGEFALACSILEQMHEINPTNYDISKALLGAYLMSERHADALTLVLELLPTHADDPDLLQAAGGILRGLSRSDLAVPVLRKRARFWPSEEADAALEDAMIGTYVELAEAAKARDDIERARQIYQEALALSPNNPAVLRGLGGLELGADNTDDATVYFDQVLKLEPEDPVAVVGLATIDRRQGQTDRAVRSMERCWKKTNSVDVGIELTRVLIDEERYAEAEYVLRRVERQVGSTVYFESALAKPAKGASRRRETPAQSLQRFETIWRRVSKQLVPMQHVVSQKRIPPPDFSVATPHASVVMRPISDPLVDIDPNLKLPSESSALASGSSPPPRTTSHEVDLLLVERLLKLMQRDPTQYSGDSRQNSSLKVDTLASGNGSNASVGSSFLTLDEGDDYTPYVPELMNTSKATVRINQAVDRRDVVRELRETLDAALAHRWRLSAGLDGRTGYAGTNYLMAAYGDVRFKLQGGLLGLYIEPFATPVVASNAVDTEQGVMLGLGIGTRIEQLGLSGFVGSSPLGFSNEPYLVGRARLMLNGIERLSIAVEAAREGVNDSILAWAGQYGEDGDLYGQVVRDRLRADAMLNLAEGTTLQLAADAAEYRDGRGEPNQFVQGAVSMKHIDRRDENRRLIVGLDALAFSFEKQRDGFELAASDLTEGVYDDGRGPGGYFSPRLFGVARALGGYTGTASAGTVSYHGELAVGAQFADLIDSPYGESGIRPALLINLELIYHIGAGLNIGLTYTFDNAGPDYARSIGWIYLEKRFGTTDSPSRSHR